MQLSGIYIFYCMQQSLQASDFIVGFLLSQGLAVRFILQTHPFAKWIVTTWEVLSTPQQPKVDFASFFLHQEKKLLHEILKDLTQLSQKYNYWL